MSWQERAAARNRFVDEATPVEANDFPTLEAAIGRSRKGQWVYHEGGKYHLANPGEQPKHAIPISQAMISACSVPVSYEASEAAERAPVIHEASPVESSADGGCLPWVRVARDPERYEGCLARARKLGHITDARKVYDLLGDALAREDQEVFVVVLCDVRGQLRGVSEVHRGGRSRVGVSPPDVFRVVIATGSEAFVVVHCHPSGKADPSDADKHLTKSIEDGTKVVGDLVFLDHVIIASKEYYSFRDKKLTKVR